MIFFVWNCILDNYKPNFSGALPLDPIGVAYSTPPPPHPSCSYLALLPSLGLHRFAQKFFSFLINYCCQAWYNKGKLYKTLDCWSRDMLNFDFLEKVLGLVFTPHFMYDFSRKTFFWLTDQYSITDQLLLEILGNMCIVIVC